MSNETAYIGRFAPSPSGPLHFGSLVAAVASYLDARANKGTWLVRMEDLDPAREPTGTDAIILRQLEAYGLTWDGEVLYQSTRLCAYRDALDKLTELDMCFRCNCSRQRIKTLDSIYDGKCRDNHPPEDDQVAIRVRVPNRNFVFDDIIQGTQRQNLEAEVGDFVVVRKDGLFAYQLAVVVDDAYQDTTHVIRGCDLIDSTPRQIYLQNLLESTTPSYGHVPVATNEQGQKLSKQHFAEPITSEQRSRALFSSLEFLGQSPPDDLKLEDVHDQLKWAIDRWDIQKVPKLATISSPSLEH